MSAVGKNEYGLNDQQLKFCERYLANGYNASEAATTAGYKKNRMKDRAYRILNNKYIKKYISERQKEVAKKIRLDLDYKYKKLKKIIDAGIPDDLNSISDVDVGAVKLSLDAIAEANKMAGDYAPTKQANLNCNLDIDNVIISVAKEAIKDY